MIYQKQLNRHDPENGIYGDCYRTAIACLLDLPPEAVPHFMEALCRDENTTDTTERIRAWLGERKLQLFRVCFEGDMALEDLLAWSHEANPGLRLLVSGEGQKGTGHVVIVMNGEVEWNTGLEVDESRPALVGPDPENGFWQVEWIGGAVC